MTTVREIITDALEDIVVQADEAPIEASEAHAAIRMLNDMMTAWDAEGITLGYTIVDNLSDTITVSAGAIRAIKANLAIELAPKYDVEPTSALISRAVTGMKAVRNLADLTPGAMEFPSTLPIGSGNDLPGYRQQHFYTGADSTILTETGGSIALESETEEAE